MVSVTLDADEMAALAIQNPATAGDGGFQSLLVSLQKRVDADGNLELTPDDLKRIPRYAFDYDRGGWEDRLIAIFSRHLGPGLGR